MHKTCHMLSIKHFLFLIIASLLLFSCKDQANKDKEETDQYHPDPIINELTILIKENPDDAELFVSRARAFYEREGYDEAIYDMSRAMMIDSINADYHHLLADIYIDYYKSRLALSTMQRAVVLHPERIPTLLKLAELQTVLTFYDESMRTLDKALNVDPQNAKAFLLMGINFAYLQDTARAIGSFQRSVQIDPEYTDAWIKLARLRASRNEPNAIQFFDNAIKSSPGNVLPYMAKADFLWEEEQYDQAIETFKEVIKLDQSYEDAYYNIGLVYLEMDSIDMAHKHFDLTINMNPLYHKAYYYRGLASEYLGNTESAIQDYEQCNNLEPTFTKAQDGIRRLKNKN